MSAGWETKRARSQWRPALLNWNRSLPFVLIIPISRNALASGSEGRSTLEPDASAFRLINAFQHERRNRYPRSPERGKPALWRVQRPQAKTSNVGEIVGGCAADCSFSCEIRPKTSAR